MAGHGCEYCMGYFSTNIYDITECFQCPEGKFFTRSSQWQEQTILDCFETENGCEPGYIFSSVWDSCDWCSSSSYIKTNDDKTQECLDCPVGSYTNTTHNCVASECTPWEFMLESGCSWCGGYVETDNTGATKCLDCPEGTVSWGSKKSSMLDCRCMSEQRADRTNGTISCHECEDINTRISNDKSSCIPCSEQNGPTNARCMCGPGKQGMNGNECDMCKGNFFKDTQSKNSCKSCATGKYSITNKTDCQVVATGKTTSNFDGREVYLPICNNMDLDTTKPTTYGYRYTSSKIRLIYQAQALTNVDNLSAQIDECATICDSMQTCRSFTLEHNVQFGSRWTCYFADPNEGWAEAESNGKDHPWLNSPTPHYTYYTYSKCQADCRSGFTLQVNNLTCMPCPENTYKSIEGNGACDVCSVGKYNYAMGSVEETNCLTCAPGRTLSPNALCISCASHTYKNTTGTGPCTSCGPGRYTEQVSSEFESQCKCLGGWVPGTGLQCTSCPAGKWQVNRADYCTNCTENQYSSTIAAAINPCLNCNVDTRSQAGSISQDQCLCKPGKTISIHASSGTCHDCREGKYKTGWNNDPCTDCAAGKWSTIIGQTNE